MYIGPIIWLLDVQGTTVQVPGMVGDVGRALMGVSGVIPLTSLYLT